MNLRVRKVTGASLSAMIAAFVEIDLSANKAFDSVDESGVRDQ